MNGRLSRSPSKWYALAFLTVILLIAGLVLFGRVVYVEETEYVTSPGTQITVKQDEQALGNIILWDWLYDPDDGSMQVFLGKGIGVPADYFADGKMDLVAFVKHPGDTSPTVENVYEDADSAVLEVTGVPHKFGALALDLTPHGVTRETNPDVLFERRKQAFSGEKSEEEETDETTRLFTSDGVVKRVDALDADADAFRERTHDRLVAELEWRVESYE
ncbi:hypothetical protein, partial [Exiguobacterium sp. 8A]|uniref:hypothetical protein n=1 Tax=Exiguobacterium sp. 8A TaxID=2653139 RepID=UPI00135B009B